MAVIVDQIIVQIRLMQPKHFMLKLTKPMKIMKTMKAMIGDLQSQIDSRQAKQVAMVRKLLASAQNAEQPAGALLVEPVPLVTTNEDRAGLEQQLEQARAQLREASAREVALTEQLEAAKADAVAAAAAAAKAETVEAEAVMSAFVAASRDGKAAIAILAIIATP